jgi:lipopolysaccharide exporter
LFRPRTLTDLLATVSFRGATGVLALTTVGSMLIRVVSSIVLTRLLTPSVYGLVGIITSLFFVVVMVTDLGFESFIIRHPNSDSAHFRNVLWTVHALRGAFLAGIGILGAPLVASALQKPELALPLAVASVTLAINGLASFSLIITLKTGGAAKLTLLDFALNAVQTVLCIVLAVWLRNVWAIVAAMIVYSLLRTLLSYVLFADSTQRFARDRHIYAEFLAFSRIVWASSSLTLLITQSDKVVLARLLTLQQFGLYAIALNIVSVPVVFVGSYVGRIVYPIYSRAWNSDARSIGSVYYAARQRVSLLFALGAGALIGGAQLLVSILYDARYRSAWLYVSLLAISAALRLQTLAGTEVMTASGRVSATLRANLVRVAWLCVAGPIGFYLDGATGVICAVGLLEVPALIYTWLILREAHILDMRQELRYLATVTTGAASAYLISRACLYALAR